MAPTLLDDTTSQFATRLGVEEIEVGLYCDVDERVVVKDVTTRLLLQPYPIVSHQDPLKLGVVAVEFAVKKVEDPGVDVSNIRGLQNQVNWSTDKGNAGIGLVEGPWLTAGFP